MLEPSQNEDTAVRLIFWFAEKGYELRLGPALIAGAARHGDIIEMRPLAEFTEPAAGGGLICGVVKREILWAHQRADVPLLYMDKGYYRDRAPFKDMSLPKWWRLCWNDTHPTQYLMNVKRPPDRWELLDSRLQERNPAGRDIVILGSSAKFHHTCGLPHPTEWARDLVRQIRTYSNRQIVYRPKPSWADAEPVDGTVFDHGKKTRIEDALARAYCSITYGSIACVDSIMAGVPAIVLGNGVAGPVAEPRIPFIPQPRWVSHEERVQWISNLCYCHWRPQEIEDGSAWAIVKEQLYAL